MKTVIFDVVRDGAMLVYPDDPTLFSDTSLTTVAGRVVAVYVGDMDIETYIPEPEFVFDPRPELTISSISGPDYVSEELTYFEASEGQEVVFTGAIDVPDSDRPFTMPIVRKDTGRVIFARAQVFEGVFTATVKFPVSGLWETNAELVNQYRQPDEHLKFNGIQGVVVV
ncbi:hypothetical protein [Gilvimarinus japonicus]|uniref:Uncharacterized protein n=1 Tax=Gilvimarinus japonicus TaxID=1796469 RepID=A0ABV7HN05_9GAMM